MLESKLKIEERTFKDYYPVKYENKWYVKHSHGVQSNGITPLPDCVYMYSIESPSASQEHRKYLLTPSKAILGHDKIETSESYFRGLIGEQICRIIMMELVRRNSKELNIRDFGFLKMNNHPSNGYKNLEESEQYVAFHLSRYTVGVSKNSKAAETVSEYDGLLEYRIRDKKGLIVCESKTGGIGTLSSAQEKKSRKSIEDRIINPLQELFPEHSIDYMLMAPKSELFLSVQHRTLRPGLIALNELFNNNGIGFIPLHFNETKSELVKVSSKMHKLHITLGKVMKEINELVVPTNQVWIDYGDHTYLFKGRRVERIYDHNGEIIFRT